ncbi:MAG: 30S ribosomal protein S6 [Candidatus Vogelbacteria bacterium]|nr:30S ribosomal protein S6 [Candidatus Vogelbacteria bacterium]
MENNVAIANDEVRVYEIGYLLSPLVSAESIAAMVEQKLKQPIIAAGGSAVSDLPPRTIRLAYPIKQTVGSKPSTFREAFFGAWRFRLAPEAVPTAGAVLRAAPELLRHLLVEVPPAALAEEKRARARSKRSTLSGARVTTAAPAGRTAISQEEMDKEIDQLLTTESYASK